MSLQYTQRSAAVPRVIAFAKGTFLRKRLELPRTTARRCTPRGRFGALLAMHTRTSLPSVLPRRHRAWEKRWQRHTTMTTTTAKRSQVPQTISLAVEGKLKSMGPTWGLGSLFTVCCQKVSVVLGSRRGLASSLRWPVVDVRGGKEAKRNTLIHNKTMCARE